MRYCKCKQQTAAIILILTAVIFTYLCSSSDAFAEEAGSDTSLWPAAPEVYGTSAILMDADSGAVLYAQNADEQLYPASITKIMTGLLAVENLNMNDTITYNDEILNSLPSDAAKLGLVSGETTTVHDALYALMLRSANEAAVALADKTAGTESAFAEMMTERARQAGALNTNFVNATGLHDNSHYTTAYDMAMITRAAMSNSEFSAIWGSENYTLEATNMSESYRIWHRHSLLLSTSGDYYSYAIGGKTGYTDEAGRTLVTAAEKDGLKLICVIMKSDLDHIFSDTVSLFEYGFHNFTRVNISEEETRFGSGAGGIPVLNKLYGNDTGIFSLSNDSILIPSSVSLSEIPYIIEFLDTPDNNIVASITYEYEGYYLGEASLMMNLSEIGLPGPKKSDTTSDTSSSIRETTSINIYILLGGIAAAIITGIILVRIFLYRHRLAQMKKRRTYK